MGERVHDSMHAATTPAYIKEEEGDAHVGGGEEGEGGPFFGVCFVCVLCV